MKKLLALAIVFGLFAGTALVGCGDASKPPAKPAEPKKPDEPKK